MAVHYEVDRNDKRLTDIKAAETDQLSDLEQAYADRTTNIDNAYDKMTDQVDSWEKKQTDIQNKQTDFAIEKIEHQQEQARKDYLKEQSGAYVDWQKQSNQYGVNAEQTAAMGMTNTGYSESSQVSMYNAYQNRVAVARESFLRITTDYDLAMKDARLQNSAALAEIAANAQQQRLQYMLDSMLKKDALLSELTSKKLEVKGMYASIYQNELENIYKEMALKEEARQADLANARQMEQIKIAQREIALQEAKFAYEKQQAAAKIAKGGSGGGSSGGGASSKGGTKKVVKTSNGRTKTVVTTDESKSNSGSSGNAPVDMQSVLSLGYGPISASRAYELVKQGLATTYVKDGKTYFRKSAKFIKNQSLFG